MWVIASSTRPTRWLILGVMPNYRRYLLPGAVVFFTVVTDHRRRFLVDQLARRCLREAFRSVRSRHPFHVSSIVLLPDHLHAIWNLPEGDANYAMRWRRIKEEFTERYLAAGGHEGERSASRVRREERAVWQRRFWEHTIRDEHDFERHIDYIHYNPASIGSWHVPETRRIPHFLAGSAKGTIRPIGAARLPAPCVLKISTRRRWSKRVAGYTALPIGASRSPTHPTRSTRSRRTLLF